jgi:hypothetical protein
MQGLVSSIKKSNMMFVKLGYIMNHCSISELICNAVYGFFVEFVNEDNFLGNSKMDIIFIYMEKVPIH